MTLVTGWRGPGFAPLLVVLVGCPSLDPGPPIGPVGESGTWEVRADIGLGPRQETGVIALGGEVFVLGGFDASTLTVATVEAYDPSRDTWRQVADLPAALHHANAVPFEDSIFVLGSLRGLGFEADGEAFRYDVATDTWSAIAPLPEGTERGGGAAVAVGEHLYVLGGVRGGEAVAEVHRYSPADDTWETAPALPAPRDHLVAGVIDGVIYAAGGRLGRIASHAPSLFAFDPDEGAWVEKSPLPTSRAGAAGAVLGGRLFVLGGEGNPEREDGVFPHVEAYDPATDGWEALAPLPTPRHGMGAAAVDGVLYVPGGAEVQGLAASGTHEAFTP